MRVLVFGAGASKAAGYPLANDLLPAIASEAKGSALLQLREAWQRWEEARGELSGLYLDLVANPNPEVTLSLLDLIEIAATSAPNLSEQVEKVRSAKSALLECLKWFFSFRHHEDGEHPETRDYLRPLLRSLDRGDVVLTLNWDTVVERTLAGMGKWNPTLGYGFACGLFFPESPEMAIPDDAEPKTLPSDISVLKLHGSFGWYETAGDFYIAREVLNEFGFEIEGTRVYPKHPRDPELGPDLDPVLLYPSFLKRLERIELREIWHNARRALDQCDRVEIYGYSLPETDIGVHALFNDLRFRLDGCTATAFVQNPNEGARYRWRDLLGDHVEFSTSRLE